MNNFLKYDEQTILHTPLIAFSDIILLPCAHFHITIDAEERKKAIEKSHSTDNNIIVAIKKNPNTDLVDKSDLLDICIFSKIDKVSYNEDGSLNVVLVGLKRCRIDRLEKISNYFEADVKFRIKNNNHSKQQSAITALRSVIRACVEDLNQYQDTAGKVENIFSQDDEIMVDMLANLFINDRKDKLKIFTAEDLVDRMELLYCILFKKIEIIKLEKKIHDKVKQQIDKNQKEYYLNEQLKSIHEELGSTTAQEAQELREKAERLPLNAEAKEKVLKEISRFEQMNPSSPELTISKTYVEYILDLPWGVYTEDVLDIENAKNILDKHHYGLEEVKERIIEFIAVLNKSKSPKGPILCFVGPPGVGKTSIVRAIAEALNKKFIQVSLGGVRDEAEIRGHRRTYIAAIPGRIIAGMKHAGSMNPLFLFDEIDKMASDFRGDPASAMLEVLDGEQNNAFRDHYLELPFDLSSAMFITTANNLEQIPTPLLDRLEIIEVPSYTQSEKLQIAKKHLIPKLLIQHGISKKEFKINDTILSDIIDKYTRESGVRQLERIIAKLIRKSIVKILSGESKSITINNKRVSEFLGYPKYKASLIDMEASVGIVKGLAFTMYGGVLLTTECVKMNGSGKISFTGKLGNVMKESAEAAYSWLRANAERFNIAEDFFKTNDLHLHFPEGAVPKDGPSAGVTIATAIYSVATGKKVNPKFAMTGEITLRGNVLAIGGLKEKLFACYRNKIENAFIPYDNIDELSELPDEVKNNVNIIPVRKIDEILEKVIIDYENN